MIEMIGSARADRGGDSVHPPLRIVRLQSFSDFVLAAALNDPAADQLARRPAVKRKAESGDESGF
jgi:hypothetical protein